jgi:hypothetical protein
MNTHLTKMRRFVTAGAPGGYLVGFVAAAAVLFPLAWKRFGKPRV